MSNFEGLEKNGRTFRPKGPGAPDVVVARPVGGAGEPPAHRRRADGT